MKYFVVLLPMLDEEKSKNHRQEHLDYLVEKEAGGHVFAKGRFVDGYGGMVIYVASNLAEVEAMVKQDPYILTGARTYEIHEWEMKTKAKLTE